MSTIRAGNTSTTGLTYTSDTTGQLNLEAAGGIVKINGTGALTTPVGTTAERPATPAAGMTRYNTTNNQIEYYTGTDWYGITAINLSTYNIELLVVGGGGAGAYAAEHQGGGGGGGGQINYKSSLAVNPSLQYTVTVGAGGAITSNTGPSITGATSGFVNNSLIVSIEALGGYTPIRQNAGPGGNTSKLVNSVLTNYTGGTGAGSNGAYDLSGGGGAGAGGNGNNASAGIGGVGGNGYLSSVSGSAAYYAGGGGGGSDATGGAGTHGGGRGEDDTSGNSTAGTTNTGGGGGGAGGRWGFSSSTYPKAGGSGVVILRYLGSQRGTGGTVTTSGGYTIHTFTTSGTYTA